MTNFLIPPDLHRSYSVCADWLELLAFVRASGLATDGDVIQPNDILEDRATLPPEDAISTIQEDRDIIDQGIENALAAIYDEINTRATTLQSAYPFVVEFGKRSLKISVAAKPDDPLIANGHTVYHACLLMSALRSGLIDAKAAGIQTDPVIGNLFQICATVAAAGYVGGDAYWFGHPRPDQTPLLDAVKTLASHLQAVSSPYRPPGETKFAKDGGIDVVAWRDHRDGRPAKLILYGQCASGLNWESKPVQQKVHRLDSYYIRPPSKNWLPALLVPFPIYMDKENSNELRTEEARISHYRIIESEMGIIIDRLRIVCWFIEGLRNPQPAMSKAIERMNEILEWRDRTHALMTSSNIT